jgi:hypothetical protein
MLVLWFGASRLTRTPAVAPVRTMVSKPAPPLIVSAPVETMNMSSPLPPVSTSTWLVP